MAPLQQNGLRVAGPHTWYLRTPGTNIPSDDTEGTLPFIMIPEGTSHPFYTLCWSKWSLNNPLKFKRREHRPYQLVGGGQGHIVVMSVG